MKTKPKNLSATSSSAPPRATPSGWQTVKLGEVCEFDKVQGVHRDLPYVGLEHIESHTACFIGDSEPQTVKSMTFRFSTEHVLYGRLRPYLNKALAPDFEGHCSTEIFPLKPGAALSREFLLYWLLSGETMERINATCSGARMPRADMNEVLEFEIQLPPLPEQRRIVGILDEALAGIAAAKAHAERNRQNARALFESHLHAVFSQPGPGSTDVGFSDVCEISSALVDPRLPEHQQLVHIGGANIEAKTGELLELKTAEEEGLKSGKFLFDPTMVLYSKIRPYLMKVVRPDFEGLCSADIYPLAPKKGRLSRDFLFHLLLTPEFTEYAIAGSARAGMPKVNREHLFAFRFTLPPMERQKAIARRLDALAAETRRLEGLYERKAAALDELKQSLLHQAFSGGFDRLSHRSGE